MSYQQTHPIHHCLQQRAAFLGNLDSWEWVLRDPVVGCFATALPHVEEDGLIQLSDLLRQTCQDLYWHTAAHWVRREHRLKALLIKLEEAGISVIPLKGAALLESIYKNIGLRNMVDVDILVRGADFLPTAEIFLAHGLQPKWSYDSGDLFEFTRLPVQYWPGELSFCDSDGLHIDVHRDLVTYHWFRVGFPVEIESVWARTIPQPTGEDRLWKVMLSPYDMLGHLCLHLALHGLQGIKNLFDVDQWLRNLPDEWDWVHYLKIANRWQIRSVSYHVFAFCQHLFGTPVPEAVMQAVLPSRCDRWVVRRLITSQAILANRSSLGTRYPSLIKFSLMDGIAIKLKTIRNLLLPGRSWLINNPSYQRTISHWVHLINVIGRGD